MSLKPVVIGRIGGVHGVYGWVRIRSFTVPVDNVLDYTPWELRFPDGTSRGEVTPTDGRKYGGGCLARFAGYADRDAAFGLVGADILVGRDRLPPAGEGEYYWEDLIGCRVITRGGIDFGCVNKMMETGANDVLVVRGERERLVPFVFGEVVLAVDLEDRMIRVDWDAEF
uniref:Ribosome maturation factor RimM n=1 Tax=Candidatus Kentrum sp. SD TaxID=2126332 RepID=A0A450YRE5_9GAMM|nr:MAG: 16S rRNA processing protein RimM [Candidatus Kentron sp. SD]VFK44103.1 MAG: 16S rRNA processing protein RimM [Candidatus Kentron sp. SD]